MLFFFSFLFLKFFLVNMTNNSCYYLEIIIFFSKFAQKIMMR